MTTPYTWLSKVKTELMAEATANKDDRNLMWLINQMSARLDLKLQQPSLFVPYIETRTVPFSAAHINSARGIYYVGMPFLALSGIEVNGSALTIGTNVQGFPTNGAQPYTALRLIEGYCGSWYDYCAGCGYHEVEITATWGYRTRYATEGWQAADTLSAAIANTTVETFTVTNYPDSLDSFNLFSRFSPGMMLKIDSEFMLLIKVVNSTKTLTVKRGWNGSTAAAHSNGATVSVFQVEPALEELVRQACFRYAKRGAFEGAEIRDGAFVTFPQDLLPAVYGVLQDLQYAV